MSYIRNSLPEYTYSPECIAYSEYRVAFRVQIKDLAQDIRDTKKAIAAAYAADKYFLASNLQSKLAESRSIAREAHKELDEKRAAWKALLETGHQYRTPTAATVMAAE